MSDEGMDPCECLYSHENAMSRLISLLRQSQSYCTDTECLDNPPGQLTGPTPDNSFILMSLVIAFALAMYFLRPRPVTTYGDTKPHNNGSGSHGAPPTPPPSAF